MSEPDYSLELRRWKKRDPEGFAAAMAGGFTDADREYFASLEKTSEMFNDIIKRGLAESDGDTER